MCLLVVEDLEERVLRQHGRVDLAGRGFARAAKAGARTVGCAR